MIFGWIYSGIYWFDYFINGVLVGFVVIIVGCDVVMVWFVFMIGVIGFGIVFYG